MLGSSDKLVLGCQQLNVGIHSEVDLAQLALYVRTLDITNRNISGTTGCRFGKMENTRILPLLQSLRDP
ncbi:hypothetical protein D3C75_1260580 [compost metagenome]